MSAIPNSGLLHAGHTQLFPDLVLYLLVWDTKGLIKSSSTWGIATPCQQSFCHLYPTGSSLQIALLPLSAHQDQVCSKAALRPWLSLLTLKNSTVSKPDTAEIIQSIAGLCSNLTAATSSHCDKRQRTSSPVLHYQMIGLRHVCRILRKRRAKSTSLHRDPIPPLLMQIYTVRKLFPLFYI